MAAANRLDQPLLKRLHEHFDRVFAEHYTKVKASATVEIQPEPPKACPHNRTVSRGSEERCLVCGKYRYGAWGIVIPGRPVGVWTQKWPDGRG